MADESGTSIDDLTAEEHEILEYFLQNEQQGKPAQPGIPLCDRDVESPLSFGQLRMWLVHELNKEQSSPYDNLSFGLRIRGALNTEALQRSLAEIVRRHEVLRTTFVLKDDEPVQVVADAGLEPELELNDLSRLAETERECRVHELLQEAKDSLLDLATGPLFKPQLIRLASTDYVLVIIIHHIINDAWSNGIFIRELKILYECFDQGRPSPLQELPIQYRDFSQWQRDWLQGDRLKNYLDYWTEQLADLPVLELPLDRQRPPVQTFNGAVQTMPLSRELSVALADLSKNHGVTLFMTMLSALGLLLQRYGRQDDIGIGTAIANRDREELQGLIGLFLNMLVMRLDLSGDPSIADLLERVKRTAMSAYTHQHLPFEKLVEAMQLDRDSNRTPLFQISLTMLDAEEMRPFHIDNLEVSPIAASGHTARFDLEVYVFQSSADLSLNFTYNTDLFEAATIERMLGHYRTLLEGLVADPNRSISELPMLSAGEQQQFEDWNQTSTQYPADKTVSELFEMQAATTPDAIAVDYQGNMLSYGKLNQRANQLAHYLRARGVGPEVLVGLHLERSLEMIVSLLAILKAGGAYLPLDLDYPQTRIKFMLEDAGVPVLISLSTHSKGLPDFDGELLRLDSDWERIAKESTDNPASSAMADSLAYVNYTSGSTGTPKGVEIPHHAISRLVCNTDYYQVDATDRIVQASSVSFDAATFEIWGALLNGAQLVGIEKEVLLNAKSLATFLEEKAISAMFLTTALFNQIAREAPAAFEGLRGLMFGGEAADPGAVRQVLTNHPPERLLHVYGPTESTTFASWYQVDAVPADATTVPIGRPVANTTLYILDENMNRVPVGVPGELYIGGDGLARGYLNRPEFTSERFVPDPRHPKNKLYRTGDKVRYRRDGAIEYLGRFDHQVKLRGFRIELGEIETVLGRHEAVQDAVVLMHEDETGEKRLVAYVVQEKGSVPTPEALHQHIRSALPEYMLPSAFVFLEILPLTPNGKVDRASLPLPDDLWVNTGTEYTAPRNELEQQLAQIWAEVLKLDRVGIYDNFFNLGGHSLLATRVVVKINESFESNLSLARFMTLATVESLVADIEQSRQAATIDTKPLQARVDLIRDGETFPMSYAQERLWYIHALYPDVGAAYNVSFQMQLDTSLAKIEAILQRLQQQHAILRTTYIEQGAQPVQKVNQTQKLSLHVVDVSDFTEEEIQQELFKQARILFDLETGPIWRSTIVKQDDLALAISIAFHHIAFDGISMNLLKQEIFRLCQQDTIETDLSSIQPGLQYIDYALWQRDYLDTSRLEFLQTYWKRKLSGIPSVMDLPLDNPRPTTFSYSGGYEYVALNVTHSNDLRRFARENNVTLYMLMLAIFKLLLSRYTQQTDIVVGTPVSGRTLPEMDDIIGLFVNSVVLRTDLTGGQTFTALLRNVRETTLEAFEHQELPFEKIVEIMQPEHDPSHNPIFQAMFSYFVQEDDASINAKQESGVISKESASGDGVGSHVDLSLNVQDAGDRLLILFSYNDDLFEASSIHQMMTHYRRLLEVAIASPETRIDRFELLGDEEKQLMLYRWNQTRVDFVKNETLTSLFEQQVRRTPQAIAVRYEQDSLDYSQLDQRATAVAGLLVAKSVMPGQFVGVYMERSIDFVVTILGILKAGAAYIPLDPDYPQERINYIVSDSDIRILLSQKKFENKLPSYTSEIVYLDSGESYDDVVQGTLPVVSEDMLAYVIYTSGSTGNPKGVMISHAAVVNHACWMHSLHDYGRNDRILQRASASFDVSVYEIFTPLLHGACVVLADPSRDKDIDYLIQTIRQEQITVLAIAPSALRMLIDRLNYADSLGSLRLINCGGEAMALDLMRAYYEKFTAPLYNFYGSTETTIDATSFFCEADFDDNSIPIGRPGSNARAYILDTQLQPVPIGVRGELHIAGTQLAEGYLNRKELTEEKFITDPFAGDSQQRMYRTGDLARYRRDGTIDFCGRVDNQVKLRGNRIELGEIESILLDHEKIDQAAVMVREDEPGDQRLVAYLVPKKGTAAEAALTLNEVIYDCLKQKVPAFMVPSRIEWMEAFPLSPSGKINYNEFPRPSHARKHTKISNNKPESEMEIIIAKIWEELLDIDDIETSDMFFDLGGHSLLTLKVVDRFAQETNIRIPPASLVAQTLRQLAAAAETSARVSDKGSGNGVLSKIKRKLTRRG